MDMRLENLTGEELLLVSVLGESSARDAVEQELDRRALLGPPRRGRRGNGFATAVARRRSGQAAA